MYKNDVCKQFLPKKTNNACVCIYVCVVDVDNFHKKSDLFVYKQLFVADFGGGE